MYSQICELRDNIIKNEFNRMNTMQLKAVLSVNGPLLILAGAGSGKTTVLVNRIANLMKFGSAYGSDEVNSRVDANTLNLMKAYFNGDNSVYEDIKRVLSVDAPMPWEILAFTFTNLPKLIKKHNSSNGLIRLGYFYKSKKKYDKALKCFEDAVKKGNRKGEECRTG